MSHQIPSGDVNAPAKWLWMAIAASIVVFGSLLIHGTRPINHDLAWFVYAARIAGAQTPLSRSSNHNSIRLEILLMGM